MEQFKKSKIKNKKTLFYYVLCILSIILYIYIFTYGAVRLIVCLNRYNLGPKTGGDKSCEFYPLWVHFVGLCSSLFVLSCFHFYWICPSSHYDLLLDGLKIYNLTSALWWGRGERGRGLPRPAVEEGEVWK